MGTLITSALFAALLAPVPRAEVEAAVERLRVEQPETRATWTRANPVPALVTGLKVAVAGETPTARALDFVQRHGALLGGVELKVVEAKTSARATRVKLAQHHQGVRVADRSVVLTLRDGAVRTVAGDVQPLAEVKPATIDAAKALELALDRVGATAPESAAKADVQAVVLANHDQGVAGYEVRLAHLTVRIDAHAGEVVGVRSGVKY